LGFSPEDFWPVEYLRGGMVLEWEDRELFLDWFYAVNYGPRDTEGN
jgi:hypothetical protein